MFNITQHTLAKEVVVKSTGLHTGRKIEMRVSPAPANTGFVFVRHDTENGKSIKASFDVVTDTTMATTISDNGCSIATVEHLLSAFFGIGLDNAIIHLSGPEVPIMDGSAAPFIALIKEAGLVVQGAKKRLVITNPIVVTEGACSAALLPSQMFEITYSIDFSHQAIGKQSYNIVFSRNNYEKEIAPARTFGFLHDVERLQAIGLALGGSLDNAVVLNEDRIINKEGLRFPNEFVRHKILDAIGDLSLLGIPIIGHFVADKSGHRLNNLLLRELMRSRDCWRLE